MDDYTQLIKQLDSGLPTRKRILEAKDAIEALQAQVLELVSVAEHSNIREQKLKKEFERVCGERDTTQAKLRELESLNEFALKQAETLVKLRVAALAREKHTCETLHKFMEHAARPVPAVPTVPEGWKLVPVEPTEAVLNAGREVFGSNVEDTPSDYTRIYKAMLAAAPTGEQTTPQSSPTALELMREYSNGKQWALEQATPPAKTLTDAEVDQLADQHTSGGAWSTLNYQTFARAIEAALKGGA